ncbi:RNA polymerase sigma factor [Psychroserpens ponticola]|uniref:RNA polymerase sigma factor n=1 Tax=Psychroserpens ponticola TaxID=2932268 RepID=A0ABY7S0S4_9FLAO|nr:RNA polymerase sigma factor [Psychroserpens ponticola]WCO03011.1 RNA polymerase sigma factor [Psychroserpens ponticola]
MKKDSHIDAKLVTAYQAGDQSAIAELVKRWHLIFCTKAFWIVKDADLSKDIAQDSWQTIMDKLHTLQKPSSFKSWALRIVYSKSLDVLRELSRKRIQETEFKMLQVSFVEDDKENTELKDMLLKAIKHLPKQQQIVLRLFYTESYSLKEISTLLNISIGTTKSRLFHAREKLKLILKNKNYEN